MPPKKPPFKYYDINRVPSLEDEELGREITDLVRRNKWVFLPDSQLDENYAEWAEAASSVSFTEKDLTDAHEQMSTLKLRHSCRQDALDYFDATTTLTSHRHRIMNPADFPHYHPRRGYPTKVEAALGLDAYVNFSTETYSYFPGQTDGDIFVNGLGLLQRYPDGIVFPFDSMFNVASRVFEERPMILQALALRFRDYVTLLPSHIAADNRGEFSSVQPVWFREQFLVRKSQAAEFKVPDIANLVGLVDRVERREIPNLSV